MAPVTSTASTGTPGASGAATAAAPPVDKSMFMQLLVAQLRNQNPLDNPTDPTQFVTELAQFEQLEQSTNTGQDVAAILQALNQLLQQAGGTPATANTQS